MMMKSIEIDANKEEDEYDNFVFFQHASTNLCTQKDTAEPTDANDRNVDLNNFLAFDEMKDVEPRKRTSKTRPKITETHIEIVDVNKLYQFAQQEEERINPNWILLDSQASCHVIFNKCMLKNIRKHPTQKRIIISCNARDVELDTVGDLPGVGLVWFAEDGIANILSLALISDQFRVTLDTNIDLAFYVHKKDGSTQ